MSEARDTVRRIDPGLHLRMGWAGHLPRCGVAVHLDCLRPGLSRPHTTGGNTVTRPGWCDIEGCDRKSVARRLCNRHYRRWHKHGDPLKNGIDRVAKTGQCVIDECSAADAALGLCYRHYKRQKLTGRTDLKPDEERFWEKVNKTAHCWEWTGTLVNGYGQFSMRGGPKVGSHRYAYQLANGKIPDGLYLDHRCHNPKCVNPAHLRLATAKQNAENFSGPNPSNKSGIRGVYWNKQRAGWEACVYHHRNRVWVGRFKDINEAEAAVVKKRLQLFTHNDIDRGAAITFHPCQDMVDHCKTKEQR